MSEFEIHNPFSVTSGHPRHERPMWIWDQDTAGFVWANGEGVKFWSALSLERLQAMTFDKTHPAWVAVCHALESDEYLENAHRNRGIDLDLQFPNNGNLLNWSANCRRGLLQDRNAIIVELKGTTLQQGEHGGKVASPKALTTDKKYTEAQQEQVELSQDRPSILASGVNGRLLPEANTGSYVSKDGLDDEAPVSKGQLLDSLLDNMTISEEAIEELKSSIQPLSNDSGSVKINGVWIGESADPSRSSDQDKAAGGKADGGHKFSPFDKANFDRSRRLISQAPKEQLHELARLIKEAGASELLEADTAFINEACEELETDATAKSAENLDSGVTAPHVTKAVSGLNAGLGESGRAATYVAVNSTGTVDLTALGGVGDQDELERILDAAVEPVALISAQKMLYANPLFVAEFGYGDITSLINDGSDWIFPSSREAITELLEGGAKEIRGPASDASFDEVRLRSGRRMSRQVWFTPVRLIKFDRTLLLCLLADQFDDVAEGGADVTDGAVKPFDVDSSEQLDLSSVPLMSSISHEVRTPLNVIIGFSELMVLEQFGPLGNEKYHGYAKDIHTSALHALSLINDLLDLTKLKAGKWDISSEPLDLNEVVRSQVSMMREMAAQKSVRLRSDLEENLPIVMLDRRGINQILLNLLSNAIKFNNEFGRIIVETERIDIGTIRLSVRDTGLGMSEAEIAQAMEPFHQVARDPLAKGSSYIDENGKTVVSDAASVIGNKGTGLGLPIAKALAEANGVDFSIVSQKDTGTEITLLIKVQE